MTTMLLDLLYVLGWLSALVAVALGCAWCVKRYPRCSGERKTCRRLVTCWRKSETGDGAAQPYCRHHARVIDQIRARRGRR